MTFTLVQIRGKWTEAGPGDTEIPCAGEVDIKRSDALMDADSLATSPADKRPVFLDENGIISTYLEASDSPNCSPSGTTYTITEKINGSKRTYTIQVLVADAAAGIELATRAPAKPGPVMLTYVTQAAFNSEVARAEAAEATLQGHIDGEASARSRTDGTLATEIAAKPDTFLQLGDTPNVFTGQALKGVRVNAAEDALEFGTVSGGGGGGASLSDNTPLAESGAGAAGVGTAASRDDHVHPAEDLSGYATTAALNTETSARTAGDSASAQKSANLSDLASASAARTNLGLGGAATENVGTTAGTVAAGDDARITGAAQKASNLSDLGSAATARTNLGLGTLATQNGTFSGTSSGTNTGDQVLPTDATLATSDVTTNNVSITKHGWAPKAPNDATKYLDGTGAYSVPPDTGFANPMTTQDDTIIGGASGIATRLAKGVAGYVYTIDPLTGHVVWAKPRYENITATNTALTLGANHHTLIGDPTTFGTFAVSLPTAGGAFGREYVIKHIGTANSIVVTPNGADTIDGAATFTLTSRYQSITIQSDGTSTWEIIERDGFPPSLHASTHVTGGTDVIPGAVAGGNAGLLTGADKTKLDNTSGTNTGDQTISDATITTTDITTNNLSITKHGFAPKAPNDATKYLDGTGAYSVPASGSDPNQSANTVKAGPTSGGPAAPAYRALMAADIPAAYLTPGNTNLEGAFASRPAASVAGRLYIANDLSILSRDTGSAWNEYYVAGLQKLQAPVEANFAWVNQGAATIDSSAGYSVIAGADTSDSVKMRVKSLAAASNYTAIMYSRYNGTGASFNQFGLVLRDSASGKFIMFGYQYGSGGLIMEYTNPTTFSANLGSYSGGPYAFLKIQDDGTNRIFSTSPDGITWTVVNTSARTTFMTADQIGYSLNPRNATSVSFTVYSLRET